MTFSLTILNKPLKAGLTYTILQNEYHNNKIHISASGTAKKPININCAKGTLITNKTTIKISGSYIIFEGFTFRNLVSKKCLKLDGDHIILRNNTFEEMSEPVEKHIQVSGQYNRITRNIFRTMHFLGNVIVVEVNKKRSNFCMIDNNSFDTRFPKGDKNGQETIRVGDSKNSLYESKTMIYNNKFNNIDGEIEIISIKSCSNIIANNTIMNSSGQICLRHGKNNLVVDNYINGGGKIGAGGLRVTDSDHRIFRNTFELLVDTGGFRTPIALMCGQVDNKLNGYAPVTNIQIVDNDFINCFNCLALGVSHKRGKNIKPDNLKITDNSIIKCNYIFNKDTLGYGENVEISNNPLYNFDQRLRLKVGINSVNVNIEKFYNDMITDNEQDSKHQEAGFINHPMINGELVEEEEKIPDPESSEDEEVIHKPPTKFRILSDLYIEMMNKKKEMAELRARFNELIKK